MITWPARDLHLVYFRSYLHVLVPGDSPQFIHGHDVETLAEDGPLYFYSFTIFG